MPEQIKKASLYVLFAALLAGTLWRGGYFPAQKWTLAVSLLAAGAVEAAACIALRQARALRSPAFWLLAFFTVFAISTLAWTSVPDDTRRESMLAAGYLAAFFVVRSQLARGGRQALESIASWLVYAATFTSGWGLITFLWRMEPYATMLDNVLRAGSTFEYSNALSCFALMALPVSVALQRRADAWLRPLLAGAICLQSVAVLISYARFGIVALFVLFIFFVVSGWRSGQAVPTALAMLASIPVAVIATVTSESLDPVAGLLAALVILAATAVAQRYLEQPKMKRLLKPAAGASAATGVAGAVVLAGASARMRVVLATRFSEGFDWSRLMPHRLDTWQGTVDSFRVRPVTGSGLGSFPFIYMGHAIAVYTKYAHNLVLQMAVDTGIVGAALLVLFLGYVTGLSLWRVFRETLTLAGAFAVASLIFIAYNMFDWEWYVPALTAWFMVGAACLEGIYPASRSAATKPM
ncbi:MAG: O-antigen ligase family protein [Actinobacteria bacterium]|nr:O-antigen ligase family protein [Actinomycetota bacterium]